MGPASGAADGAAMLLGLAAINPDAYIAEQNIERFERTGRIDWAYLAGLSDDAAPALARLPEHYQACVVGAAATADDWLEWNLGRARVAETVQPLELPAPRNCVSRG